jgi:putative peptidoglycan lipid II flippase
MLPNFFRRIVGEGALTSAFIPVYSEETQLRGRESAFRFAGIMATFLGGGLAAVMLGAEILLHASLEFEGIPESIRLTLALSRFLFPYLWFISLYALAMGILNCHKFFWASSLGPVILDIVWIAGLFLAPRLSPEISGQLNWLAAILLISGALQLGAQLPELRKIGFRYRWIWDATNEGVRKTVRLLVPSIFSFAIVQINILVGTTIGFMVGPGANSALWYGNRLMQFPLGVFAISMGTSLLPTISAQMAARDVDGVKKSISFALRSVFLIILPSSVGLIVLSHPITQMLFQRGEFDAVSTARTAAVVVGYSIGLFAYSGQKIIANGFFAVQDTQTPVKIGVIALLANIAFNLILMGPMKEAGLALGTSLSGILQLGLLLVCFKRKMPDFPYREIFASFAKTLAASAATGGIAFAIFALTGRIWEGDTTGVLLLRVGCSMGVSVVGYVLFCFLLHVHEMREAVEWITRQKR